MDYNDLFGEIRSLAQHASAQSWAALCALLDEAPGERLEAELVPYLATHMRRWPAALRLAPWRWVEAGLAGEPPASLQLAGHLRIVSGKNVHHGFRRLIRSGALRDIEVLAIEDTAIGGGPSLKVLSEAGGFRCLRDLRLEQMDLTDRHLEVLLEADFLDDLEILHVERNQLGPETIAKLTAQPWVTALRELHLDGNSIGPAGAQLIAETPFERLELLSLGTTALGDEGLRVLASSTSMGLVEQLELASCDLTADGVASLADSRAFNGLRALNLLHNPIGDEGAEHLAARSSMPHLEFLGLSDTELGCEGLRALADSPTSASLRKLDLRFGDYGYDHEAAQRFYESRYLDGLEALFVSFTWFDSDNFEQIFAREWPQLRQLEAVRCGLRQCRNLASQPAIEEIELSSNYLYDNAVAFAEEPLEHLHMLSLEQTRLDDSTFQTLLNNLPPELYALYVPLNDLSDASAQRALELVLPQLQILDMNKNPIHDELLQRALGRRFLSPWPRRVRASKESINYTWSMNADREAPRWAELAPKM